MPEGVQAIVLCEDLQGWVFVRRTLISLTVQARHAALERELHVIETAGDEPVEQVAREADARGDEVRVEPDLDGVRGQFR